MIIKNQIVKLTKQQIISRKHTEYFINRGYIIDNNILVNISDLPINSTYRVKVICDYCGIEIEKPYLYTINNESHCCNNSKCKYKKAAETNFKKYGCKNPSQRNDIKEKKEKTFIEKYGVTNAYLIESVRIKTKEKLGVEFPFQSMEIREKQKETMIRKYGCDNPGLMETHVDKMQQTCINKYDVSSIMKKEEIKKQALTNMLKTMYKHNTGKCSSQQKHIHDLIGGELNYPVNTCQLDIAFPNEMIYIEYNGGGHDYAVKTGKITKKEFMTKEIKRYKFLESLNWKMVAIDCYNDKLYDDEKLLELINKSKEYLLNNDNNWIRIDIDNNELICSEFIKEII